jgi:molybdopterin/thiamine biosynthesis adenylyltransferase
MKSSAEIIEEVRTEIPEVSVDEVKAEQDQGGDFVLLDVRDDDERRAGYIPGAIHVTRGMLELSIDDYVTDPDQKVILYCAGGVRSLLAAKSLKDMGYADTISMAGGYRGWLTAGYPTTQDKPLSHEQLDRYSRHFMLRQIGETGQAKLLESKVLLLGAGGLGSPAAVYLAAAGVGTLGVLDSDIVEISNLQRQIAHRTEAIGTPKVQSATTTIKALNPDINVIPHQTRLKAENVLEIFDRYDLIVDGCDNFPTRYLVSDAAVLRNKTVVHGSISEFEGQVTVLKPGDGPCYRCMYPAPPPPGMVPS